MVRVVGFLRLHHEYHHCVSSVFLLFFLLFLFFCFFFFLLSSLSSCLNAKRYPFSGHFYRSLEAPRLSNFLGVDVQLKMIIQSRMKDFPIQ